MNPRRRILALITVFALTLLGGACAPAKDAAAGAPRWRSRPPTGT